jgi:hypothetical protein
VLFAPDAAVFFAATFFGAAFFAAGLPVAAVLAAGFVLFGADLVLPDALRAAGFFLAGAFSGVVLGSGNVSASAANHGSA